MGSRPFLSAFPAGISLQHPRNYLLVAVLAVVATAVSRALSYGTLYTTKLLRRGIDIDRPRAAPGPPPGSPPPPKSPPPPVPPAPAGRPVP